MGHEYDFVFDVDIEDGKPPLKLPYNLSQNPYDAATKFIEVNKLPISYLEQVANFITTNTQGATIGQPEPQSQGASDPWGSDNRYRPGETSSPAPAPPKILPQKTYLSIVVARIPPIQKKIQELNEALISSGQKDISLNPTELTVLASLCKQLESADTAKAPQADPRGLELAVKLTTTWPYKDRLPGLDLLRLLAVAPTTAAFSYRGGNIVDVLAAGATEAQPPADNNVMMAVRSFANLFESREGRALAASEFAKIHELILNSTRSTTNRNLLVAATTVYINYAVAFAAEPEKAGFDHACAVVDTLGRILGAHADAEVVYRALVALGTLLSVGPEIKTAARDVYGIEQSIAGAVAKASDPRIKNVAAEIRALLK
jgi:phospholipase A-2-activating protein